MTDHEKANQNGVHHATVRGARASLAKKEISSESFEAFLAGDLSLDEARELGRNAGPGGPAVRVDKTDRSRECMCGCGRDTRGRFAMGHDQVLLKHAYEYLKGERELTGEQLTYVRDETDKLERAKARVEREEAKAKEQRRREKAERQKKAKEE